MSPSPAGEGPTQREQRTQHHEHHPPKLHRRPLDRPRGRAVAAQRRQRPGHRQHARRGDRLRRGAGPCAPRRHPGVDGARLPAARRTPQGTGQVHRRQQGNALRGLGPHRRDARRRLGRHRGRRRHAGGLRGHRQQRAALGQPGARGPGLPARQEGRLRGHPHPGAARRRGGAHQRLQLPGLGPAREVRAQLPRGHALHRQAGHRHQLPHRGGGAG